MMDLRSEFIKFFWVGVASTLVDWAMFATLYKVASFNYIIAVIISFTCGAFFNFIFNRQWTFQVRDGVGKRLVIFLLIAGSALLITTGLMALSVEVVKFEAISARVVVTGIIFIYNYFMHKYITFGRDSSGIKT